MSTVFVTMNPDFPKQGFWDTDKAHEGGEIFLSGDGVFEVEQTQGVSAAITAKRLIVAEPTDEAKNLVAKAGDEPDAEEVSADAPEVSDEDAAKAAEEAKAEHDKQVADEEARAKAKSDEEAAAAAEAKTAEENAAKQAEADKAAAAEAKKNKAAGTNQ